MFIAVSLAVAGGMALAAQDKYTLQVPNGLAFSDFRGYEEWQVVSVSQTDELLKAMVANPVMIDARLAFLATASSSRTAPRLRRSSGN
jgi:hypothetical protein